MPMAPVMSTSTARKLPVINDNCALRRNVAVQPYGRCSVCSLNLHQCLAWQSSAMSFALVILIVVPLLVHEAWAVRVSSAGALLLLVVQGMLHHKRTDELIFGQHQLMQTSAKLRDANDALTRAKSGLEEEVLARTERLREANVALARANLELAELAQRRERMLLEVSHDMRTPLTSVKGAAENLLDGIAGPLSADSREYVEIMRDHADRLILAVSRLLDAARAEHVNVDLDLVSVDVSTLASEVTRSLAPIAEQRGVSVEVTGPSIHTLADARKLRKVLENLVGNALKFTDEGGRVRVEVTTIGEEVRVTVEDTGIGLDSAQLSRVFDRFHRVHEDRPGTGLGLAITRDLVRLHGGDVLVRSSPGHGSTFAVLLPQRAA
jgi:signal transduction histidine kinase